MSTDIKETTTKFATAKQFTDAVSSSFSRGYLISLNKGDADERLRALVSKLEFLNRNSGDMSFFHYDNSMYGLNRAIVTGRTHPFANAAVRVMNVRQMCKLVFELEKYSHNIEDYARFLNQRYMPRD